MFVMTPAIFEECRHTLSSTFEVQGTTCKYVFNGVNNGTCDNCPFSTSEKVCYFHRGHPAYEAFLTEFYPECLV